MSISPQGCAACLQQHKKCDEARPSCARCHRLTIDCNYEVQLRWFNGTQLPRAPRQRRSTRPTKRSTRDIETSSSTSTRRQQASRSLSHQEISPAASENSASLVQDFFAFNDDSRPNPDRNVQQSNPLWDLDEDIASFSPGFEPLDGRSEPSLSIEAESQEYSDYDDSATGTDSYNVPNHSEQTIVGLDFEQNASNTVRNHVMSLGLMRGDVGSMFFDSNDQYYAYLYCKPA